MSSSVPPMLSWPNKVCGALVPALAASAMTIEALRAVSVDHFWLGESLSFLRLPRWIAATIPIVLAWWFLLISLPSNRIERWRFSSMEWRATWSLAFSGLLLLNVLMISGLGLAMRAWPALILCCAGLSHAAAQLSRAKGARFAANAASAGLVALAYASFFIWPLAGGYRYAIDRYFDPLGYGSLAEWANVKLEEYQTNAPTGDDRELPESEVPLFVRKIPTMRGVRFDDSYYADGPHLLLGVGLSRADNSVILVGRPDFEPHRHNLARWKKLGPGIWMGRS